VSDPFVQAHTWRPCVFNLAGRTPVSIRDQLVRAQVLTQRLLDSGVLAAGSKLLVVGAGAAGATVAILAARRGVEVVVADRGVAPFALQLHCDTRWIDPVQYDWPAQHCSRGRWPVSGWPVSVPLKFKANYADLLADEWNDTLRDEAFLHPNLDLRFETELRRYPSISSPPSAELTASLHDPLRGSYEEDFDVVVIARGIAREKVSVPNNADVAITRTSPKFVSLPFWQHDAFQTPSLGLSDPRHHVLVSGGGDGALQDYIRLVTGTNSALLLLEDICAAMPRGTELLAMLRWRLAEAEEQAHRMQLWSAGSGDDHDTLLRIHQLHLRMIEVLRRRFASDWGSATATLRRKLTPRNPARIRLVHPCTHFSNCYSLNRFVALALRQFILEEFKVDTIDGNQKVRAVRPDLGAAHPTACPPGCWGQPHFVELLRGADCSSAGSAHNSGRDYHGVAIRHGVDQHTKARMRRHSLPRHLD
jgi:hypothetical protein